MFAILAGLTALLLVLGAITHSRFDGGNLEKALVGLLCLPMLAFGNAKFSKGWLLGVVSTALIGSILVAGGLPLLLSLLFLGVACIACWDDISEGEIPEVVVVEEYLDEDEVADDVRRLLAKAVAREALAKARIAELEADNLRLVAQLAQAYKPKPAAADLLDANQQIVRALTCFEPQDPQIRAPSTHA